MKRIIFFVTVIIFFESACTEKIDIDLNSGENNRLVVEGGITDQAKIHTIKLTRSTDYFVNETAPIVTGAKVSVTDGENTIEFTDDNGDGIYTSPAEAAGEPDKKYTLNIELEDGETYTAESYMTTSKPMDSLRYEYSEEMVPGEGGPKFKYIYTIYLYTKESPILGDYYMWDLFIDNELDSDTLNEKLFVSDENVNGSYIWELGIFKLKEKDITNEITNIKVRMMSISKEQYEHHSAMRLETGQGGMFDGPPANVPTNISNNGLGFFFANPETFVEIDILYKTNPDYWE